MKNDDSFNRDEKSGIDKGSKVRIEICDSNGIVTHIAEGKVLRVFPHNIVLDKNAEISAQVEDAKVFQKGKSFTIPMRWIKSIEELE